MFHGIFNFYACFTIYGILSIVILFAIIYNLKKIRFRLMRWGILIFSFMILPFIMFYTAKYEIRIHTKDQNTKTHKYIIPAQNTECKCECSPIKSINSTQNGKLKKCGEKEQCLNQS